MKTMLWALYVVISLPSGLVVPCVGRGRTARRSAHAEVTARWHLANDCSDHSQGARGWREGGQPPPPRAPGPLPRKHSSPPPAASPPPPALPRRNSGSLTTNNEV